ncbi:hypothetical protein [Caldiplasma sukawensis]
MTFFGFSLLSLLTSFTGLEVATSTLCWEMAFKYGILDPSSYLFSNYFDPNLIFFYNNIMSIFPYIFPILGIFLAIYIMIFRNIDSIIFNYLFYLIVYFTIFALLNKLNMFSYDLSLYMYYNLNVKVPSIDIIIRLLENSYTPNSILFTIILNGILMSSGLSTLIFLMLRQAILISIYLSFPLFIILIPFQKSRRIFVKLVQIYIEILLFPSLILYLLFISQNYGNSPFSQFGFLILISVLPTIFLYGFNIFNRFLAISLNPFLFGNFGNYNNFKDSIMKDKHIEKSIFELSSSNMLDNDISRISNSIYWKVENEQRK